MFPLSACSDISLNTEDISGTIQDNVYSNSYFGLNITFDDNWSFDQEETDSSADLYAQKEDGFCTINIIIEQTKEIESESQLIKKYKKKIKKSIHKEEEIITMDTGTEMVGQQEYPYIYTDCNHVYDDGTSVEIFEKQFIIKKDDSVAIVTLCTFRQDTTDELLTLFS